MYKTKFPTMFFLLFVINFVIIAIIIQENHLIFNVFNHINQYVLFTINVSIVY